MLNNPLTRLCAAILLGAMIASPLQATEVTEGITEAIEASGDIEKTLQIMVSGMTTPRRVDQYTLITKVEAQGSTLRLTYQSEADTPFYRNRVRYTRLKIHCATDEPSRALINAGATLEDHFIRTDGEELLLVTVDRASCEAGSSAQDVQLVLQDMALDIPTSAPNSAVTVIAHDVVGSKLQTTIRYNKEGSLAHAQAYSFYAAQACRLALYRSLIEDGAAFEYVFVRPDGEDLGRFTIDDTACEEYANDQ
jgi:hypothetical protein